MEPDESGKAKEPKYMDQLDRGDVPAMEPRKIGHIVNFALDQIDQTVLQSPSTQTIYDMHDAKRHGGLPDSGLRRRLRDRRKWKLVYNGGPP